MKTLLASVTRALALVAGLASGAGAQGLQTGVITGTITSNDGLSIFDLGDERRKPCVAAYSTQFFRLVRTSRAQLD